MINGTAARRASQYARVSLHGRTVLPQTTQPTITAADDQTGRRATFRIRKHGGRSLPLPPLLDPVTIDARTRYTQPKPLPTEEDVTEFQKALACNPYAHALATPVRQCSLSGMRLPTHFLQAFSGVFSPSSVKKDRIEAKLVPRSRDAQPPGTSIAGSTSYLLNNYGKLEQLLRKKHHRAMLISPRMREAYDKIAAGRKATGHETEWGYEDKMAETILETLRAEAVSALTSLTGKAKGYLSMPDVGKLQATIAAVGDETFASNLQGRTAADADGQPIEVGVYDLSKLFDEEQLRSLPFKPDASQSDLLALVSNRFTLKLQLHLQRLANYLGHQQPVMLAHLSQQQLEQIQKA